MQHPPTVVVVTRRAIAVSPSEHIDPEAAAIWGFVRGLQAEQPSARWRLRDMPPEGALTHQHIAYTCSELVLRDQTWEPTQTIVSANKLDLPWGGTAVIIGDHPRRLAAARQLAQDVGAEQIVLASHP